MKGHLVTEIKELLRAVCDNEHLSVWCLKGFWNSQKEIFRWDGIDFNSQGNFKLRMSMKGSCFRAMKQVQKL